MQCAKCSATIYQFAKDAPTLNDWAVLIDGAHHCGNCARTIENNRRLELKFKRQMATAEAIAYWEKRGISPGDTVTGTFNGWAGSVTVTGIAKVSASGAYVKSEYQRGRLDPNYFRKVE